MNWDAYYKFECDKCGNKWIIKESDALDESDQYYHTRENHFVKQRGERFLTINPDANCVYPMDSSLILLRSVPEGVILPDNKFEKGEIYISHPADNSIFFPSTSYRYDVMKDELDDIESYDEYHSGCYILPRRRLTKCNETTEVKRIATITIKGVYQLNGPKPFTRVIECSPSETGYYSQLMGSKSKQAQWIQANFPGANVGKGFSMSVNIK